MATAAELLSTTLSDAIKCYFPNDPSMMALAEFAETMDAWFDVSNSTKIECDKKPLKSALGKNWNAQKAALLKAINLIEGLRARGKKSLQPWQKGILIWSRSLIGLFEYLKKNYEIEYLITRFTKLAKCFASIF